MKYSEACKILGVKTDDSIPATVRQYSIWKLYDRADRKIRSAYAFIIKARRSDLERWQKIEVQALKAVYHRKSPKEPVVKQLISVCAYATLLRQAVEFVVNDKITSLYSSQNRYADYITRMSLNEKMEVLSANNGLNSKELKYFDIVRKKSNLAVHFENIDDYRNSIENHNKKEVELLQLLDNYAAQHSYNSKMSYLKTLCNKIASFNFQDTYDYIYDNNNTLVYSLLMSTLMRHNLECIVDRTLLKEPDTYPIRSDGTSPSLYEKILTIEKRTTAEDAKLLHDIRKATNALIHVDDNNSINEDRVITLYSDIKKQYKPLLVLTKRGVRQQERPQKQVYKSANNRNGGFTESYNPTVAAVLCILFGSLGVHRFYVGDVKFGLIYLFTNGFLYVGVLVDLIRLITGNFKDSDGNYIGIPCLIPTLAMLGGILVLFMLGLAAIICIDSAIGNY